MGVCESGPMFLKAINCEGEYKDKGFISMLLIDAINELWHQNVVQVVIDNAPVYMLRQITHTCFEHLLLCNSESFFEEDLYTDWLFTKQRSLWRVQVDSRNIKWCFDDQ